MKGLATTAKLYLFAMYALGGTFLILNMLTWQVTEAPMLVVLCILASLALVIKVEGATKSSHYTFSFIMYGFAFLYLGVQGTVVIIIVSNLVEWLVNRQPWFTQLFNTAGYVFIINIAMFVFQWLSPGTSLLTLKAVLAIIASMAVFTTLNHLIVGIAIWMVRGENFKQSGIFEFLPITIDLTLLFSGALMVSIWDFNPYALVLFAFPIYLLYTTLRVPGLERQTEIDQKTGLYNHRHFMQHFKNELTRSHRFDRPLSVIMADLDLLRNINNTYGHLAGDEVVIGVAKILQQTVREYDMVARFGGEEFSIVLPETTLSEAYERAEEIRFAVEKAEFTVPTSVTPIKATLSLGVAQRDDFLQSSKDIIHNADTALYNSKIIGRNRVFAYSKDTQVEFSESKPDPQYLHEETMDANIDANRAKPGSLNAYQGAITKMIHGPAAAPASPPKEEQPKTKNPQETKDSLQPVNLFIGGLTFCAILLFVGFYFVAPGFYTITSIHSWLGLAVFVLLTIWAEWYSIDLYTRNTSLSTSAVPILAGTLLFGPIGSMALSTAYAIITGLRHRSTFNRYVFNFGNQLIAGMMYTIIISLFGKSFIEWSTLIQLGFAVTAAAIVYFLNTGMITVGMHLDSRQPMVPFWKEQYSWLFPIYLGMGIVAAAFIFGFKYDLVVGSLLVVVPLFLLRLSQTQYVNRTSVMVSEMREKNTILEKNTEEITKLNEGLLETLAIVIDLRDPYVFGHSENVANRATHIAIRMGLHQKQVNLIRNASMLHDIGKLGISENILSKPMKLTVEEYDIMKTHPKLGATILEKSPYLRPLIPAVHYHHEFYNGEGYPDSLAGNQIVIEARIIAVADAIDAMASERPYRKARNIPQIIDELKRCSGTQFDPLVAEVAIKILEETESAIVTERAIAQPEVQLQTQAIEVG